MKKAPSTTDNILTLIGNTPMVQLHGFSQKPGVNIYAKLEGQNIGGSVKDRIALHMIEVAEKIWELTKEKTILESTSGNTGIALAMIAAVKGYKILLTMSAGMSLERKKILHAYGAELIETDPNKGTAGAIEKVKQLLEESPERYWMPNQHNSLENPRAHYLSTAKEILQQIPNVTHFVAGIGTFWTLRGMSNFFRKKNTNVRIIGVEPIVGEKVDGLRNMDESNPPGIFDDSFLDEHLMIHRHQAIMMCRKLARENGILVGISSGAALWGATQVENWIETGNIVVLFPDRGEKYLSTDLFE